MVKLPEMMPPRIIDALVAAGRRDMPYPVLVVTNPTPVARYEQFIKSACQVVYVVDPAKLSKRQIEALARKNDEMLREAIMGFVHRVPGADKSRPEKDPALHALKYSHGPGKVSLDGSRKK